jgi:hypothetical protein
MKNIKTFGVLLLFTILLFECADTDNNLTLNSENAILGNWKLEKAYISAGGPQYLVVIQNGEDLNFQMMVLLLQQHIQHVQ